MAQTVVTIDAGCLSFSIDNSDGTRGRDAAGVDRAPRSRFARAAGTR